jgi:hypothetical protein
MNRKIIGRIIAPCIFAASLTVSWPAMAEMLYLKCGPQSIVVDLTANTVAGAPATISPSTIAWTTQSRNPNIALSVTITNNIDRVSGIMTTSAMFYMPDGSAKSSGTSTFQCAPDTPPQTRF